MQGLTTEQKDRYWEMMQANGKEPLTDKDKEAVTLLLTSEPGSKALGRVLEAAENLPKALMSLDLSTPIGMRDATHLQGRVAGYVHAIEIIFDLITLPEESENDES